MEYYPIVIRLAPLRPDSGVYSLRGIAPHIFINPQSYSYVVFKNKLIFFLCSVNDAAFNVLFMKTNTARNLVSRERYIATISLTTF